MTAALTSTGGDISPPITLTTDFGLQDAYVGAMKGVILGILPGAQIVDITHAIAPQDIRQAAYVLASAIPYFPPGTVHVVVVDPGVGGERRPLAIHTDRAYYIGPDNGVFSQVFAAETVLEIRELTNPAYRLPLVSSTFHGRDIFAPAAAHIAAGVAFPDLGPLIPDPVRLPRLEPQRAANGSIHGHIVHVDHFGNLISDIPAAWLEDASGWAFEVAGKQIVDYHATYARVETGPASGSERQQRPGRNRRTRWQRRPDAERRAGRHAHRPALAATSLS